MHLEISLLLHFVDAHTPSLVRLSQPLLVVLERPLQILDLGSEHEVLLLGVHYLSRGLLFQFLILLS